jgi:signal transduction histidine kinase
VSFKLQAWLVAVLAAGVLAAWIRARRDPESKTARGRLRQLGWCLAFAALTISVTATVTSLFERNGLVSWLLIIAVGVAVLLALRPSLAARIVPLMLIALGLCGFVIVRDSVLGFSSVNAYGLTLVGNPGIEADLVLPQAYAFLLLGGWLTWRSPDPVLARGRVRLLGKMTALEPRAQLRALLLLPAVVIATALVDPVIWLGHGAGIFCSLLIVGGAVFVLRKRPELAARIAAVAMVGLGLAGLRLVASWHDSARFPGAWHGWVLDGAVLITTQHTADVAAVQGLALLGFGAWLMPQAFPQIRRLYGGQAQVELTRRVARLTESRSIAVDSAAADLRRLERDLHDGAQARLVALGMSLRAAERLIPTSTDAALALVVEAREASARALTELRELVRGVHPPVLADRGLADAVRALALDCPLAVQIDVDLPGTLPAPVETACYFAVAEVLTNAAKHSSAREARIAMSHDAGLLRIEVTDFGLGGADPARGSGLAGVERRLASFDGILAVSSPAGGPTIVVMEVPCALSSPRISSC